MVDMVVHRHELRETLSNVLHMLMKQPAVDRSKAVAEEEATTAEADEPATEAAPAEDKAEKAET
jgi:hypothetical protein